MSNAFPIASVNPVKSGIYGLLNKTNGKIYIGSAIRMANRWRQHRHDLIKNKHRNSFLQNAFNKCQEAFEFFIIEEVKNAQELISREQFWMNFYKVFIPDYGYNISMNAGSSLGLKRSDEYRANKSRLLKGILNPLKRKKITQMDFQGNDLREFESVTEASKSLGFSRPNGNICSAANGAQKTAYGFKWRYSNG